MSQSEPSHEDSGIRRSSRSKHVIERYDDQVEMDRKRSLLSQTASGPAGQAFFQALQRKYASHKGDFSIPKDWIDETLKMPGYRHLKQNLYRFPHTRPTEDEDDSAVCSCTVACDCNCMNKKLYIECVPTLCGVARASKGGVCGNCSITTQAFPRTEVISTPGRGYGLILLEPVPEGTIICEYMGEVISSADMLSRMRDYTSEDHFYFASLGSGLYLDASKMGSFARFANHSCEPSCRMERWTVKGERRIVLTSQRPLTSHTEVTYCYNFEDDGWQHNPYRSQQCLCGSQYCSGKVGKAAVGSNELMDALKHKAFGYLKGEKAAPRAALQALLDSMMEINHASLQEAIVGLQALLVTVDEWLQGYEQFVTQGQLMDIQEVDALLDSQPACLRSDARKRLKSLQTAHKSAQLTCARCAERLAEGTLTWDDLSEALKQAQQALPVRVQVDWLLREYLQVLKWCGNSVMGLTASLKAVADKLTFIPTTTRCLTFSTARRLALSYGYIRRDSQWPADQLSASSEYLNERLSVYLQVHTPGSKSPDTPLCYCRIYEDSGDCPYTIQCACGEWYHLVCLNFPSSYAAAVTQSDHFHCPSCLLGMGLLSNFALQPDTEWTSQTMSRVAQGGKGRKKSGKTARKSVQKPDLLPVPAVPAAAVPIASAGVPAPAALDGAPVLVSEDAGEDADGAEDALVADASVLPEHPLDQTVVTALESVRSIQQQKAYKLKYFLSPEDLQAMLTASNGLIQEVRPVPPWSLLMLVMLTSPVQSPVAALLQLSQRYLHTWQASVTSYLTTHLPAITGYLTALLEGTVSAPTTQPVEWLQGLLRLYFQLSILRIKSATQLALLRPWIWALAASPLLTIHTAPVTLYDLSKVLVAGRSLSKAGVLKKMVERFAAMHARAMALLQKCKDCRDTETARKLVKDLEALNKTVHVSGDFQYARMQCWARIKRTVQVQAESAPGGAQEAAQEGAQEGVQEGAPEGAPAAGAAGIVLLEPMEEQDVYCWCRQNNSHLPMICCDGCNEWFHNQCVGLEVPCREEVPVQVSHSFAMFDPRPVREGKKRRVVGEEERYFCISCTELLQKVYTHTW